MGVLLFLHTREETFRPPGGVPVPPWWRLMQAAPNLRYVTQRVNSPEVRGPMYTTIRTPGGLTAIQFGEIASWLL